MTTLQRLKGLSTTADMQMSEPDDERSFDLSIEADYYKTIAASCDYAESKGVELTLKPHGGTNATGAWCRAHTSR